MKFKDLDIGDFFIVKDFKNSYYYEKTIPHGKYGTYDAIQHMDGNRNMMSIHVLPDISVTKIEEPKEYEARKEN